MNHYILEIPLYFSGCQGDFLSLDNQTLQLEFLTMCTPYVEFHGDKLPVKINSSERGWIQASAQYVPATGNFKKL